MRGWFNPAEKDRDAAGFDWQLHGLLLLLAAAVAVVISLL